jgi:hypothetical protein
MKYIITESQLDKLIFKYLDSKDFVTINLGPNIFFSDSEDSSESQITYDKTTKSCFIARDLINEISNLFDLNSVTSTNAIGEWVKHTQQVEVNDVYPAFGFFKFNLRIE